MAKLHEYTSESDFTGYYIYGVLHRDGHTTIQVSPTAKQLFDYIEVQPGETVPNNLLRGLLDTGLLYTGRRRISDEDVAIEFDTEGTKSELSEAQFNRLLEFIQSYDGPRRNTIRHLAQSLELGDADIPELQTEEFSEESDLSDELVAIADGIFENKSEKLRRELRPKLRSIPGNTTSDQVDELTDGWALLQELFSSDLRVLELDVLEEDRIRYQIETTTQTASRDPDILTIIQNTARLTNTPDFTIIADRSVHFPPSRKFEITHRVQLKNGSIEDWILTGKITSHVQKKQATLNLEGTRDKLFRQLQKLTDQLPYFTLTQSDPYTTDLKYDLDGIRL